MPSNFDFLSENWSFLQEDAQRVETFALRDPRTAAFYARRTLERALQWLYQNDTALKTPYDKSLAAMIHEPTFRNNVKPGLFQDIRYIHRLGNLAAHEDKSISTQEGMQACTAVHRFMGWMARVYTRGGPVPGEFRITLLPKDDEPTHHASVVELQKVREQLILKEKAEADARAQRRQTDAELAQLREQLAQLQAIKLQNQQRIPKGDYTETQTRDAFIDLMLREAGWDPKGQNVEEFEVSGMPNNAGTGKVDYVLWGADGLPLAVVEAKKTKIDPAVGKHQAELYADCLQAKFGQRPIIFYTNAYTTWMWDDTEYPPRVVEGFYKQDELQWLINRRSQKQQLTQLLPKPEITERYYQREAAARVMEAFGEHKRRKALIVMATGTGKTRLSIAIVDMLMRGNWARKVLFLADRIALVTQAKREFNKHLPHVSVASLLDKKEEDARILFSTYPTMLNLIDGTKKDQTDTFSVGHFDLIIIDEAHRSVYQKYGAIFDYFDSLLIGLTATPRGEVDHNTYKLFKLPLHQPTYAYELTQAVDDKFLVPPKAISVPLKFQREGIHYDRLSPEEQEEYELQEQFYDDDGELKEEIGSAALNQWLFNQDTVDKVLMHLIENGLKVEGGDKLGKTIVFAKNRKHAKFIVERFDENYPHVAGKFCAKIDFEVKYAQDLIDKFSVKDGNPQIAVSVDMLDTGIDVPEVLNLVFFKLVRSKTKFWQMVGRGTRLCPDLFAPGEDKSEFIIFDYCQNLEFFQANPKGFVAGVQEPIKQQIFRKRLALAEAIQNGDPNDRPMLEFGLDLKNQMHEVIQGLNIDNFIVRKHREPVEYFNDRKHWNELSDKDIACIDDRLTGLPSADNDDETARRFDLLVLNLQVAVLQKSSRQTTYQNAIREIAENLEDKKAIPLVAAQMELILDLQTDIWWKDVTLPMLEGVRRRVRDLVRFVDRDTQIEDVYTNFEDELFDSEATEHQIVTADPNLKDYRRRVEKYIRDHQDHITIRRLKNNEPISKVDIQSLEDLLFEQDHVLPREAYKEIYGDEPLGVLVRSVVGLDRNAAKKAFAEFLQQAPLNGDQITFLNEVVEYLVKNGVMQPKELFDAPFNRHHEQGVTGVLGEKLAKNVVELISRINANAAVG